MTEVEQAGLRQARAQGDMVEQVVEVVQSVGAGESSIEDRVAQEHLRMVEVEVEAEHGTGRIVEAEECRWQRQE